MAGLRAGLLLAMAVSLAGARPAWSQMPLPAPVPPTAGKAAFPPRVAAPPAANAPPTANMAPPAANVVPPAANMAPPAANVAPPAANVAPPATNVAPPVAKMMPPAGVPAVRLPLTVDERLGRPSPPPGAEPPPAMLPFPLPASPAAEAAEEPANPEPATATDVHLSGNDKQTRLAIDLSRKIDMRAFTLADPYRVVIEIPQVKFELAADTGEQGRGIIKAFRYGLVRSGGSRIVVDLTGPVRVTKAVVLDSAGGKPAQMVLDVAAVDRETFMRAAAIDNHLPRARLPRPSRDDSAGDSRPVVVIDPGHGGIDPGTRAPSGELEKDLTLDFAAVLRAKLEATGKYRVMMTRSDDRFIELSERVQLARQQRAQLLISIHCDALARGEGAAQGATVYTVSDQASDAEAQRLADAENRADAIAGVDLDEEPNEIADILIELAQRETKTFSAYFARDAVKEMSAAARMHKHPQRSAGFRVLKAPDVPSVLIELGYVSNPRDLKQLVSDTWRARTGDALVRAVQTYFTTRLAGSAAPPHAQ
jgi:N-acetylmuramoyl-L-alanine amidase